MERTFSKAICFLFLSIFSYAQDNQVKEVKTSVENFNAVSDLLNPANQRYCSTCAEQNKEPAKKCDWFDLSDKCKMYSPEKDFIQYGAWRSPSLLKAEKDQQEQRNKDFQEHQKTVQAAIQKEKEALEKAGAQGNSAVLTSPNGIYKLPPASIGAPSDDEKTEASQTFEMVRATIVRLLHNGKNDRDLSSSQKELIKRVQSIRFEAAEDAIPTAGGMYGGLGVINSICSSANAYYLYQTHTVKACPVMFKLNQRDLFNIFAHEIGHSIDPCIASFPLYKVNKQSASTLTGGARTYYNNLNIYSNSDYVVVKENPNDPMLKNLIKTGVLSLESKSVTFAPSTYPYHSTLQCLTNNNGIRTNINQTSIVNNYLNAYKENNLLDDKQLQAKKNELTEFFNQHSECMVGPKGLSQSQEVFGDWLSSEAVTDVLKNSPDTFGKDKKNSTLAMIGIDLNLACKEHFDQKNFFNGIGKNSDFENLNYQQYVINQRDSHPSTGKRINRIYLANPTIQKNLACSKTGNQTYCGGK